MAGSAGLAGALRARLDLLLESAQSRLDLIALELQEEKLRLARLVLLTVLASVFLAGGIVFALILITVALWDSHRLLALALGTVVLLGAAVTAASGAARTWRDGRGLFSASLAELRRDREALRSRRPRANPPA